MAVLASTLPGRLFDAINQNDMTKKVDVIIIGGSYSGLAAAMSLGRAMINTLVIDAGKPCNRQTPHSHNFLTRDGFTPSEIAAISKSQVNAYPTVEFFEAFATSATKSADGFQIEVGSGQSFVASQLIFATGISDIMPNIEGFAECWGTSVLHCPYCHGYEVRNVGTGIIGNGEQAYEFAKLISNWTNKLTVFTNGASDFSKVQSGSLRKHGIDVIESEISELEHDQGKIKRIVFKDGTSTAVEAIYSPRPFVQHCALPEMLGCDLTDEGYVKTDGMHQTTIPGVFACGDNASRMRTVANAVATGTATGIMVSKRLIMEGFN